MLLTDLIPLALQLACPHCRAAAGKVCTGPGVVRGIHAARRELARDQAMERGAFGRVGQVVCPACDAQPGKDCQTASGRARRAGFTPLFHDERYLEARTTTRRLTRRAGEGGYRLVDEVSRA